MKQLIRRLSRVSDSSDHHSPLLLRRCRPTKTRFASCRSHSSSPDRAFDVPEGHLPVYVGEEMERFVVRADLLGRPAFVELLRLSAQEYGYEQRGVLRIPCPVAFFERVLEALKSGGGRAESEGGYAVEIARLSLLQEGFDAPYR